MALKDSAEVKFTGFDELARALKILSKGKVAGIFKRALNRSILPIETDLKGTAAWADRTGELRGSIEVEARGRPSKGLVSVGVTADYRGRYLEFGWIAGKRPTTRAARLGRIAQFGGGKVGAHPWISPVYENRKESTMKSIIDEVNKELTVAMQKALKGR